MQKLVSRLYFTQGFIFLRVYAAVCSQSSVRLILAVMFSLVCLLSRFSMSPVLCSQAGAEERSSCSAEEAPPPANTACKALVQTPLLNRPALLLPRLWNGWIRILSSTCLPMALLWKLSLEFILEVWKLKFKFTQFWKCAENMKGFYFFSYFPFTKGFYYFLLIAIVALRRNAIMNLSDTCQEAHWKNLLIDYPLCTEVPAFPFMWRWGCRVEGGGGG